MRIHYLIHAPFEKLGVIEDWARKHNHSMTSTHTYKGESLPKLLDFDLLIIMGGPQSALELDSHLYLKEEIALAKRAIHEKKAIIGICLGAQILGEALGAKALKSPHKEIGLYPITVTTEGEKDPIFGAFSKQFDVMHWHSDMPGIPQDAVLLAKSEGCPHQAFRFGDRIYGFQFHLELTHELIAGMIENCPDDLKPGKYIRSTEELLNADFASINKKMYQALDHIASQVSSYHHSTLV